MQTTMRLADLTPGTTAQIEVSDPAKPGAMMWIDVTVTADAPVEAEGGVELVTCRGSNGRTYRRAASAFRRVATEPLPTYEPPRAGPGGMAYGGPTRRL